MATAAAAVVAKARRRIVSHFMSHNAVSPDAAVAFEPARLGQQRQFARMRDAGVIVDGDADTYWLNLPEYDAWQGRVRRRIGAAIGLTAVAGALVALFAS